nr:PREDICTED: tyrosine kinase receptor Cad96Ca-like [Latimeria chalumnae]|eukprot:XP_006011051.1 PREDICTED: tyrosine kinase receptor Cad96Ca-like [Latimeria chalumnae]
MIATVSFVSVPAVLFLILAVVAVTLCKRLRRSRSMPVIPEDEEVRSEIPESTLSPGWKTLHFNEKLPLGKARILHRQQMRQPRFSMQDLSLLELLKVGKLGRFYKAKVTQGSCRGHKLVTCKIAQEGIAKKRVVLEILIMKKLGYHKSVLQLLAWNTMYEPYLLIMESADSGNLKMFLRTHQEQLRANKDFQKLLTLAVYNIALGMEHVASKMVIHRDLALRNILIGRFPQECKIAEFGLAQDLSSYRDSRSNKRREMGIPLRWYPPEFFRENHYHLKGDVWSFGILLWEMTTFGASPYPELKSPEEVMIGVCSGHRMRRPHNCREIIHRVMERCWIEKPEKRPSFSDIVRSLEDTVEQDADYISVSQSGNQYPEIQQQSNRISVQMRL